MDNEFHLNMMKFLKLYGDSDKDQEFDEFVDSLSEREVSLFYEFAQILLDIRTYPNETE